MIIKLVTGCVARNNTSVAIEPPDHTWAEVVYISEDTQGHVVSDLTSPPVFSRLRY